MDQQCKATLLYFRINSLPLQSRCFIPALLLKKVWKWHGKGLGISDYSFPLQLSPVSQLFFHQVPRGFAAHCHGFVTKFFDSAFKLLRPPSYPGYQTLSFFVGLSSQLSLTYMYTWVVRGNVCSEVSCLTTQHADSDQGSNRLTGIQISTLKTANSELRQFLPRDQGTPL